MKKLNKVMKEYLIPNTFAYLVCIGLTEIIVNVSTSLLVSNELSDNITVPVAILTGLMLFPRVKEFIKSKIQ